MPEKGGTATSEILDEARNWTYEFPEPYERARAKFREALEELAFEVFEQPWVAAAASAKPSAPAGIERSKA
jgi:hypothetical protein